MSPRAAACAIFSVLVLLGGAGCATLPSSSTPVVWGTLNRAPADQQLHPPAPWRPPDLLVQDFLNSGTMPGAKHAAARQFLTKDADAKWVDGASTVIVENAAVLRETQTDTHATFVVRANRVGQLLDGGVYEPDGGSFEAKISLTRLGSDWRIDSLPPGVILDRQLFYKSYASHELYFLNPSGTALVPDPRWIVNDRDVLASQLISILAGGPRTGLAPAVRNELAGGVSVNAPTRADDRSGPVGVGLGGVKLDLHGAGALDQHDREMLAAQVVWTLDGAGIPGPYVLQADGKPLDERFPGNWSTTDVAAMNPTTDIAPVGMGLNVIRGGRLEAVDNTGVTPVSFGAFTSLQSGALSRDGKLVAAVAAGGRGGQPVQLVVGAYGGAAATTIDGTTISTPTWFPDNNSVWAVIDGTRVIRAVYDDASGATTVADVDTTAVSVLGKHISALRLSRDGLRAALIVDDKLYLAIVTQAGGHWALTSPHLIPIRPGGRAMALTWISGSRILVSEDGTPDAPLIQVPCDGAATDAFSYPNLTPPVHAVEAVGQMYYIEDDSHTLLQLRSNDPDATGRFWREVPGVGGSEAAAVVAG